MIAGIDVETELHRIVSEYRLTSDLGIGIDGVLVGTNEKNKLLATRSGWHQGEYGRRESLVLGKNSLELVLVRPTTDVEQITTTGLVVMVGSVSLTTMLLLGLSVAVTGSIARPIQKLSSAAEAIAQGDLSQRVEKADLVGALCIGDEDEIGLLAEGFNRMVAELRGLYTDLESKVEARTHELATSAEIARIVSSSLDLETILKKTAEPNDSFHFGY